MSPRGSHQPLPDRLAAVLGNPAASAPRPLRTGAPVGDQGWVPDRAAVRAVTAAVPTSAPDAAGGGRHRRPAPTRPAVVTVPESLRRAAMRPRRLAVLGLLLVLAVASVVLGVRVAWARSSAEPHPVAAAAHGPPDGLVSRAVPTAFATGGATAAGAGGATAGGAGGVTAGAAGGGQATVPAGTAVPTGTDGPSGSPGVILVHIVGQVGRPGVVRLAPGARVVDALTAAGDALRTADLTQLNLARPVTDGEQIFVPKPGEKPPLGAGGGGGTAGAGGTAGTGGTPGAGAGAGPGTGTGSLIDLNTADAAALDSLPGVGPVLAQRILDWRAEHGRFASVDQLSEVSGIGPKLLAQLTPRVRV